MKQRGFRTERNLGFTEATLLGIDKDNAVCTAHTVHCGRRCVLEDREGLDFVVVDKVYVAFDTVHEHKRTGVEPGSCATDEEGCAVVSGFTGTLTGDYAGDGAAQGIGKSGRYRLAHQLRVNHGKGAGNRCLLLGTVTDDDSVFQ